jgi:nucleotide-binding universal stress UspA family protein
MSSPPTGKATAIGPVLLAYDGGDLAALAIEQAGLQLENGREALVVCVWQPADVGFMPVEGTSIDAGNAAEVRAAAEQTAAQGASLAEAAGFHAEGIAVEKSPTWKGIVGTAEERGAGLIVIGSHRHGGLMGHVVGNIASAVVNHSACDVLLVHPPAS